MFQDVVLYRQASLSAKELKRIDARLPVLHAVCRKGAIRMALAKAKSKIRASHDESKASDRDHSPFRVAHASRVLVSVSHRNNLCPDLITPGIFSKKFVIARTRSPDALDAPALPYGP